MSAVICNESVFDGKNVSLYQAIIAIIMMINILEITANGLEATW